MPFSSVCAIIPFSVSSGYKKDKVDHNNFKYAKLKKVDEYKKQIVWWKSYDEDRIPTIFNNEKTRSIDVECYWK